MKLHDLHSGIDFRLQRNPSEQFSFSPNCFTVSGNRLVQNSHKKQLTAVKLIAKTEPVLLILPKPCRLLESGRPVLHPHHNH